MHPLTRQSRHPVMVFEMTSILAISALQIFNGPDRHVTLAPVPPGSYLTLALVTFLGCVACISATVQSDSWTAGAYELFGSILLIGSLIINSYAVITGPPYPETSLGGALMIGLCMGLIFRCAFILKDAFVVIRSNRAPPVGDMDMIAVAKVDAVNALVLGTHALEGQMASAKAEVQSIKDQESQDS